MMNARWSFLAVPLLAALGCSDPVPLPAKAAVTLSVRLPASTANGTCPDSGTTYYVGEPLKGDSGTLIDGDKGAHISCSVKGSGAGFAFSGSLSANTTQGEPNPIVVSFSSGVVDANGVGTTDLSVFTPKLTGTFRSNASCAVQVMGNPPQVKGGSIWASVSCPSITAPPAGVCQVGPSVIVFENCDGS